MGPKLSGFPGQIYNLTLAPDGKTFAASYNFNTVGFFDSATFKLIRKEIMARAVSHIVYLDSSTLVACGASEGDTS